MGPRLSGLNSAITRAYPAAARRGNIVRAAAVLDVAFDHLLYGLHERDVYEPLDVTFKGGTALRKFYIGHRGRFSFDLDFDVAEGAEDLLAEEVDGMVFPHFEFTVRERRGHYTTDVASDLLDEGFIPAKMDFSTRGLWLPAQQRLPIPTPLHDAYPFDHPVPVPVITVDENVAEKLGRWQEKPLIRDLYDLAALGGAVEDPQLVARMWVLKRHAGMTSARRRGGGPAASVADLTDTKPPAEFMLADLVLPTDPPAHAKINLVHNHLAKVDSLCRTIEAHMTPDLHRYADDRGALHWEVQQEIAGIKTSSRSNDRTPGRDHGGYPSLGW